MNYGLIANFKYSPRDIFEYDGRKVVVLAITARVTTQGSICWYTLCPLDRFTDDPDGEVFEFEAELKDVEDL